MKIIPIERSGHNRQVVASVSVFSRSLHSFCDTRHIHMHAREQMERTYIYAYTSKYETSHQCCFNISASVKILYELPLRQFVDIQGASAQKCWKQEEQSK